MMICFICEIFSKSLPANPRSLKGNMVFFIMNARIYRSVFTITPPMFWHTIIPALPVYFLSVACILNLNHWIAYYFKIGEMALI